MAQTENSVLKFFILDTPKQHEIQNVDLDSYFRALKQLSSSMGLQIVFSTTEYRYVGNKRDVDWEPRYEGEKQMMFLKTENH